MSKPIAAIAGRSNVGKSTLSNVVAGDTIFVVKDTPGMTRGRVYADCDWLNMNFMPIDTGGIEPDSKDIILSQIRGQTEITVSTADVIISIVNACQGLVDSNSKMADLLHKSHRPVVLVVNKVDSATKYGNDVYEFYGLGTGEPVAISAVLRLRIGDLLDEVMKHFDSKQTEEEENERPRIAVVDKPNVGKSSITNKFVGENRVIVPDIADTTRDAVDTKVIHEGTPYAFIDTAGLRRKNKIKEELERYSVTRTVSAVERADVVVVAIDATEGVTRQGAKVAGTVREGGKGIIAAVSKWDAIEKTDKTIYKYTRKIKEVLSFIPYAEHLFVSVATGQRLTKLFEMIGMVRQSQSLRVTTGVLDEIMTEAVAVQQLPSDRGKRFRIYRMTQVAVKPPTFVIFVNDKELIYFFHTRYLENQVRNASGSKGASLKPLVRE